MSVHGPSENPSGRFDGSLLRSCFVSGLLLSIHLPLVFIHLQQLWQQPHLRFFPLLIAGVAALAWSRRPASFAGRPLPHGFGYGVIVIALCLQVVASGIYSPRLATVALLITLIGIAGVLFDRTEVRMLLPLWLLLWLTVPLPFGGDRMVVRELQSLTLKLASAALDTLGVYHFTAGSVLELPGRNLFVDEACTGVNAVFALVALAGLFACHAKRPWPVAIPLMASAVFWTGLISVVRVVGIVLAIEYLSLDLTQSLVWSWGWLPVTLLLLLGTDHLLMLLFGPIHRHGQQDLVLPSLARLWNRLLGWNESPLDAKRGAG